uniref:Uncharacterized protein n=1 Tax=Vitis vinifera TaxID=29760 RepID=F6I467_VITVI
MVPDAYKVLDKIRTFSGNRPSLSLLLPSLDA